LGAGAADPRNGENTEKGIPDHLTPLEGHRLWAAVYDSDPNPLLALEFRVVEPRLRPRRASISIDVGCGTGRRLGQLRDGRAFGIDLSPEMLAVARSKPGLGGRLVLGDAAVLPFAAAVSDQTFCSFCAGYLPEMDPLLRELARVTRSGGRVLVSDLHPSAYSRGWRRAFKVGSRSIGIQTYRHDLDDMIREAARARLELEELCEPAFGEPERKIFRQAEKETEFESLRSGPAIFVAVFRKR
jgi:ubiquinone/menaquinone biosynthesis C-methylase UbiE